MPEFFELLTCPATREPLTLTADGAELVNTANTHRYPILHGIPDFRQFDPPYMSRAAEAELADRIAEASARLSYDQLIEHYERSLHPRTRSTRDIESSIEHRRLLRQRAPGRLDYLLKRADAPSLPRGLTLDLGCGSGEASSALLASGARQVIGLDISLVELMLARKLLTELGLPHLLVAGCGEAMPFADGTFDFVYSPDVIEHVADQSDYLREVARTLAPGGDVLLNSPNRYSVVCPEPHVGLWFVTFLPRPLISPACEMFGRGPYLGKRLLSLNELRTLVCDIFPSSEIHTRRSNPASESLVGRLFYLTRHLSEPLFSHFCDQHVVRAYKPVRVKHAGQARATPHQGNRSEVSLH